MTSQTQKANPKHRKFEGMQIINPHAAGIDLGSESHWVCLPGDGSVDDRVKEFKTDTPSLEELADWLSRAGVTTVAMESTGVYWIPLYELLDARGYEVVLARLSQKFGLKQNFRQILCHHYLICNKRAPFLAM